MSVIVTISGTPIAIPVSGDSPNWAPAITEFAQLTASALSGIVGTYDVSPQSFLITSDGTNTFSLTNLSFPTSNVRSAIITYNIERVNSTSSQFEEGTLSTVYNGTSWDLTRNANGNLVNGSNIPFNTFSIANSGQISLSTITIGSGTFTSGKITYSAKALAN